jgi:hypothetical protein
MKEHQLYRKLYQGRALTRLCAARKPQARKRRAVSVTSSLSHGDGTQLASFRTIPSATNVV